MAATYIKNKLYAITGLLIDLKSQETDEYSGLLGQGFHSIFIIKFKMAAI